MLKMPRLHLISKCNIFIKIFIILYIPFIHISRQFLSDPLRSKWTFCYQGSIFTFNTDWFSMLKMPCLHLSSKFSFNFLLLIKFKMIFSGKSPDKNTNNNLNSNLLFIRWWDENLKVKFPRGEQMIMGTAIYLFGSIRLYENSCMVLNIFQVRNNLFIKNKKALIVAFQTDFRKIGAISLRCSCK